MASPSDSLELLDPQIDIVSKMLLLRHRPLLGSMLEAVLEERIASLSVLNPEISGELPADRAIVVDILVELADGRRVNVEMQVRARPELRPRLLYYAARNLSGQLRREDSYLGALSERQNETGLCGTQGSKSDNGPSGRVRDVARTPTRRTHAHSSAAVGGSRG